MPYRPGNAKQRARFKVCKDNYLGEILEYRAYNMEEHRH